MADGLEKFPIYIRAKRAPVKPDEVQPDESDTLKLLPPPLLPVRVSESPVPSLVESESALSDDNEAGCTAVSIEPQAQSTSTNLLDDSIKELNMFALNELSKNPSAVSDHNDVEADDPFSSLSLTVQGRIIPCIPCENKSPTGQPPAL